MYSRYESGRRRSSSMFAAPSGYASTFVGASFARFNPSEWESLRRQRMADSRVFGDFDAPPLFALQRRNSREDERRTANSPRSKEACELLGNRMRPTPGKAMSHPVLDASASATVGASASASASASSSAAGGGSSLQFERRPRSDSLSMLASSVTALDVAGSVGNNPLAMLASLGALGAAAPPPLAAASSSASAGSAAAASPASPSPPATGGSSAAKQGKQVTVTTARSAALAAGGAASGESEDEAYRRFEQLKNFKGRRGRTRSSSLSLIGKDAPAAAPALPGGIEVES